MARYTCSFILSVPTDQLQASLVELLQDCHLDVQYYTSDYILAREALGSVSISKLVTVEILIDKTRPNDTETRMSIVIKNEELPLQRDNHCRQIFEYVKQAIEHCRYWHLIESIAG
ncbi:hypothetical protein [Brasilonema bromeliae]|uniref:Uncharacterized protein n=1 Tax=Brasilonema bromeliae SPC951 TaxID=385972 RepID=A0ABX1P436_9CYAN|nr:hypothetical protein [Brasilonema bromeliae]NMG18848.1 hypothetical protein [Brasilonema bromeliae SPC951]